MRMVLSESLKAVKTGGWEERWVACGRQSHRQLKVLALAHPRNPDVLL